MRLVFAMLFAAALVGCNGALIAIADGDPAPQTLTCKMGQTGELVNGDFRIEQDCNAPENLIVGDKLNEATYWTFRFSKHDRARLERDCEIETAVVDLALQTDTETSSDSLSVKDKWDFGLKQIQAISAGKVHKLSIDFIDPLHYTPAEIKRLILAEPSGELEFHYADDALVSHARLTLKCACR